MRPCGRVQIRDLLELLDGAAAVTGWVSEKGRLIREEPTLLPNPRSSIEKFYRLGLRYQGEEEDVELTRVRVNASSYISSSRRSGTGCCPCSYFEGLVVAMPYTVCRWRAV
jgi:hypothetical protein